MRSVDNAGPWRSMGEGPSSARAPTPPADPEVPLDPAAALLLANRAARRVRGRVTVLEPEAARDIAADALVVLLERAIPLRRRSVLAAVKLVACNLAARRTTRQEADLADWWAHASAVEGADEPERARASPLSRTFKEGSTARLDGVPCEADVEALALEAPDGSVTRGREALRRAHRLLLEERCLEGNPSNGPQNARRTVEALERDAHLLSVVGLPWRVALERLAATGVVVTRDGLRSGQRAARLRCMGLTAHGYYACAVAGGIDRVAGFGLARNSLPADSDSMPSTSCSSSACATAAPKPGNAA